MVGEIRVVSVVSLDDMIFIHKIHAFLIVIRETVMVVLSH